MNEQVWSEVDRYADGLFNAGDDLMEQVLLSCREAGLPEIQISPSQGKLLQILALACRAKRILEIGTLGGYSAIWLARALPDDGKLITLEIDSKHAEVARSNFAISGLEDRIDLRVGKALDILPRLVDAEPFDLIFIDADKTSYPDYLSWSLKLSRTGTLIIADNVVRRGEVINASSGDTNVPAVRRFNDALASDPRIDATILQTVGVKGYDGFAIGCVSAVPD